jgi:hypothetical protein
MKCVVNPTVLILFSLLTQWSLAADSAASADWQQTLHTFDEWAAIQKRYDAKQIAAMRQKIADYAASLAPSEGGKLRAEINAKLRILLSTEANAARQWLAETLAVASDSYAQKIEAGLPDVVSSSPQQLAESLRAFEARETNLQQVREGMKDTQQVAIKALDDANRRQVEAAAQARAAASAPAPANAVVTPVAPRTYERYSSPYGPTLPYLYRPYAYGGFRW